MVAGGRFLSESPVPFGGESYADNALGSGEQVTLDFVSSAFRR